jgi:hypothetical protein
MIASLTSLSVLLAVPASESKLSAARECLEVLMIALY